MTSRRPMVRAVLALLAMVVIAGAVAAGCGGDDDAGDGGTVGTDDGAGAVDDSTDGAGGPEGTDEADGTSAADGDIGADTPGTDSPGADSPDADTPGTGTPGTEAGTPGDDVEAATDPALVVPEWVEVVGVQEALNVRAGPSSSFERVAQIPPGETLRVLGGAESDEGGLWLRVVFGGAAEGWVFAQYTSEIARPTPTPLPTPTPVGTPTPLPVEDEGEDGQDDGGGQELRVVAPDGLNLRDAPGLDSRVIAELDDGDRLDATGRTRTVDGREWTEVRIDGRTGWVASEFVR